jgi:uncharacterized metal-binding protein YceD (DUF177 family)
MNPEFSFTVRVDTLGDAARSIEISADKSERAALAERFGLVAIDGLDAQLELARKGDVVMASGTLRAAVTQSCVVTGDPVASQIDETFVIEFRPQLRTAADEELELGEEEMDVVFYDGAMIDVGEAVSQTLALALDPYPRSPQAEDALEDEGIRDEEEAARQEAAAKAARNPFAILRKP